MGAAVCTGSGDSRESALDNAPYDDQGWTETIQGSLQGIHKTGMNIVSAPMSTLHSVFSPKMLRELQEENESLKLSVASLEQELQCNPHWGNSIANVVWPTVSVFVMNTIIEQLEPALGAVPQLHGIKFDRDSCNLGHKPVQFTEIYIERDPNMENLVLRGTLAWEGDLAIHLTLSGFPVGIRNLSVGGPLMVELVGMITDFPLFDGGRLFFIDQPKIKLDLAGLGAILNMSSSLKNQVLAVVQTTLAHNLVLPNRFGVRLNPKADIFNICYARPEGVLWFGVWKATSLIAMDWHVDENSSDPYVVIQVGGVRFKSQVITRDLNPVFKYQVPLIISLAQWQSIHLSVYDEDSFKEDDFLGKCSLPLEDVKKWGADVQQVSLCDMEGVSGKHGQLSLMAVWQPLVVEPLPTPHASHLYVFIGVVLADSIPRAGNLATSFWVEVQCSNLLDSAGQCPDPEKTMFQIPTSAHDEEDDLRASSDDIKTKIASLRSHGVPDESIASALEIPLETIDRISSCDNSSRLLDIVSEIGTCTLRWDEYFPFFVKSVDTTTIRFSLKCQNVEGKDRKEKVVGECEASLQELLAGSSLQKGWRTTARTSKFPGTKISLKTRLKANFFGASTIKFEDENGT